MLSTAPIPSDSPNSSIVWGNIGSTETCDAQAILTQFTAIGAIFYTTILSLYFWLFISRSWNESKLRKVEPCLHAFTLLFCIISSTVLYIREVTNHGIFFCWINSVPINCEKDDNVECIRGEEVFFYRTAFLIIPIVISFLLINFFMISLYLTFRRQASIMQRYSSTPGSVGRSSLNLDSEDEGGKLNFRTIVSNAICCFSGTSSMDEGPMTLKSRKVFYKALAFIGAFFVVWSPVAVVTLMAQISNKNLFWVLALESVITPLNGFFNVLIYENTSPLTFFIRSLTRLRSMIFLKNTQEVDSDHSELHLFTDNSNEMEMNEMEVATSVTEKLLILIIRTYGQIKKCHLKIELYFKFVRNLILDNHLQVMLKDF